MKILALETSAKSVSAAVVEQGAPLVVAGAGEDPFHAAHRDHDGFSSARWIPATCI